MALSKQQIIAGVGLVCIVIVVAVGALVTGKKSSTTASTTTSVATTPAKSSTSTSTDTSTTATTSTATTTVYKDGTYTETGSYKTPQSTETITVTLTVANDIVTAASVTGNPVEQESAEYQADFEGGYKTYVVGKKLADINLSQVSGSSLTSNGFNAAVTKIKAAATNA